MKVRKRNLTKTSNLTLSRYCAVRLLEAGGAEMTANQVAYWQLQEAKRHNRVGESQMDVDVATRRQDMLNKGLDFKSQQERRDVQNKNESREVDSRVGLNRAKTTEAYVNAVVSPIKAVGSFFKGGK